MVIENYDETYAVGLLLKLNYIYIMHYYYYYSVFSKAF